MYRFSNRKRDFSKGNLEKFKEYLRLTDWSKLFAGFDADECFNLFVNVYVDSFNLMFSIKKKTQSTIFSLDGSIIRSRS